MVLALATSIKVLWILLAISTLFVIRFRHLLPRDV
jgi:hypothetical protein